MKSPPSGGPLRSGVPGLRYFTAHCWFLLLRSQSHSHTVVPLAVAPPATSAQSLLSGASVIIPSLRTNDCAGSSPLQVVISRPLPFSRLPPIALRQKPLELRTDVALPIHRWLPFPVQSQIITFEPLLAIDEPAHAASMHLPVTVFKVMVRSSTGPRSDVFHGSLGHGQLLMSLWSNVYEESV